MNIFFFNSISYYQFNSPNLVLKNIDKNIFLRGGITLTKICREREKIFMGGELAGGGITVTITVIYLTILNN